MRSLVSAIGFLTIIPVKKQNISSGTIIFFPLIGLFLGGIMFSVHLLITDFSGLSVSVIVALLLAIYTILTGGLHLDGLSDTVDGLFGGKDDKKKILSIMDDSRIGAEGTIAIILDILIKFVLLVEILRVWRQSLLLLIFPVISRWSMVFSMLLSKPAKDSGLGRLLIENTKIWNFIIATFILIAISILVSKQSIRLVSLLSAIIFCSLVTICFTKYFIRKIGGMTGDTFGSINEFTEITSLLIFIV